MCAPGGTEGCGQRGARKETTPRVGHPGKGVGSSKGKEAWSSPASTCKTSPPPHALNGPLGRVEGCQAAQPSLNRVGRKGHGPFALRVTSSPKWEEVSARYSNPEGLAGLSIP